MNRVYRMNGLGHGEGRCFPPSMNPRVPILVFQVEVATTFHTVGTAPTIQDVCTAAHREATTSIRFYI